MKKRQTTPNPFHRMITKDPATTPCRNIDVDIHQSTKSIRATIGTSVKKPTQHHDGNSEVHKDEPSLVMKTHAGSVGPQNRWFAGASRGLPSPTRLIPR